MRYRWLRDLFETADKDGSGSLSVKEVLNLMKELNVSINKKLLKLKFKVRIHGVCGPIFSLSNLHILSLLFHTSFTDQIFRLPIYCSFSVFPLSPNLFFPCWCLPLLALSYHLLLAFIILHLTLLVLTV